MSRALVTFLLASSMSGCCYAGSPEPAPATSFAPSTPSAPSAPAAGGPTAACDSLVTVTSCRDQSGGAFALGEEFQRGLCMGTYTSGGACPAAARIGSCDDGMGTITRYYGTGNLPYSLETARSECMMITGNIFTPG
jgi:hypothetical protein